MDRPFMHIRKIEVTVASGATTGTANCDGEIIGFYPIDSSDVVKSVSVSSGVATVTLTAVATSTDKFALIII